MKRVEFLKQALGTAAAALLPATPAPPAPEVLPPPAAEAPPDPAAPACPHCGKPVITMQMALDNPLATHQRVGGRIGRHIAYRGQACMECGWSHTRGRWQ